MSMTRRELLARLASAVAFLGTPMGQLRIHLRGQRTPVSGATLWVDSINGNDNNTRAQVRAGGGAVAWQTLGRAVWGSTSRSSPAPLEAADAGDVVAVAAGTYTTTETVSDTNIVCYKTANTGTAGNPIRFVATGGTVVLVGRNSNSPALGGSSDRNYIEWYADVSAGNWWKITNDGRNSAEPTTPAGTWNTPSDAGAVVVGGTGHLIEGFDLDGGVQVDWSGTNYMGVRLIEAINCTVRNCKFYNYYQAGGPDSNSCGVETYGAQNCIIEHCETYNCTTGIMVKDRDFYQDQYGVVYRYNLVHDIDGGLFNTSLNETVPGGTNHRVYQNVVYNSAFATLLGGIAGSQGDWVYNNAFYNLDYAGALVLGTTGSSNRFWNNIIHTVPRIFYNDGSTGPSAAQVDCEHNVFYNYTTAFYSCTDGTKTLGQWKAAYPGQDGTAPLSRTDDPQFTNAAGHVFTLQGTSPCLTTGRDPNTDATVPCGAYITGTEVIGLET